MLYDLHTISIAELFFFKSSYFILHMKGDSFSPVQLKAQKRLAYYVKESFFEKLFFFSLEKLSR